MASAQTIPVKVGVVLDMNEYAEMTLTCISMALSDFYDNHDHYRTRLVLTNRDSKGDVVGAAAAALDLLKNVEVQAIIGPMYSEQASFLIALGNKAQVPIITFSATSPSLSSLRSPYFIRATLNDSSQVDAVSAIIQAFGWREVVPIYVDNEFGEGIMPFLTDALENVNARVPYRSVISPLATDDQIEAELYKLMTMQTRVFVVHMLSSLASRLFTKAKQLRMMSREYAWIITDGITNELSSMDRPVIESMLGVIGVKPYVPKTQELDDFRTRYKRTIRSNSPKALIPDFDIFGLWAYDSAIALAMAAEKATVTNPTYREANVSVNSTELEEFGKSESGPGLIQALSTITFKGLSGDFKLVDGQLQAPPYEIINMVGPGDRGIGYWTTENGITNVYSTSKSNLGSIIWPEDPPTPPKGWVVPTNGKRLRVGVPVKEGFKEFMRVTWNADNTTNVEGYCIDVFDAVMQALPYGVPYDYIPFATPDHKMIGDYNINGQNFDAVAGDVTIVGNRSRFIDFTLPFTESGISMVVPIQDDKRKNTWLFVKPLTWEMWLTSFCSFVFIGVLIWILEHRINEDFRGPFWYQVGMIFWFGFSTMVYAHKERVVSNLARVVLIIWFVVVLILTQSYTASLTSMLTVQKLQPKVKDAGDLIKSQEYVGYMKGSFVKGFLKGMKFDPSRLREYDSMQQLDEFLTKGSKNGGIGAYFHEIPYIKLFLGKYGSKYTTAGPTYKANGFGFVFPIGSPLVPDVSRAILNVTESQKMVEIEKKWLGDNKITCPESDIYPFKSLGLASFWGLFLIIGIVGVLAFIFYLIKFLHENWSIIRRPDPEATVWSKIVELFKEFDNKDMRSHTFQRVQIRDDGFCSSCMHSPHANYQQSPSSSPWSPRPLLRNANFQGEQGEPSRVINREIEFANIHANEQVTLHEQADQDQDQDLADRARKGKSVL
ncbi:glutamate receptor 2.8 [Phtheirospermum japonicum]|uniref:Glutamate receptor n=1 Tax=Phtheirospermum japonicum TaxID=374723 RepID=A0A830B8Q2_9LAMI|nr:glutamate receptor 2.8 [Phtheirospermum japonicum]